MAENKVRVIDNLIKENVKFEDIIEELGDVGKFQIRLNVIFNFIAAIFSTMSSYAKLLALTVPEHWCHVPGREDTNLTVEMWKNLTIPRTEDGKYSRCLMKVPGQENETSPCQSGWDYDATWFSLMAASQENWVCDKELYPSTVYSVSHLVAAAVGVLLFYIGDRFGRRKQFLIGMSATALSQTLLPVSASVLPLYTALSAASEGAHFPMSEAMIATGIELAPIKHRSTVNFLSFVSYCLGVISMALVAWFLKNWIYFTLVAAVLCFIPLLLQSHMTFDPVGRKTLFYFPFTGAMNVYQIIDDNTHSISMVRVIDNLIKENVKFEDIIEELGDVGKFQIRLNVIFNFIAAIFSTMSSYAKLLALTVPEHWCHVPGREDTNLTVEMWKNLTIPRTEDGKYSRCLMKVPGQENETSPCQSGWDYDATWFSLMAASQENWVCDKELYPSTVYSVSHLVAAAVGVLLFYIGDRFGRRKQFLIGMSATALSQTLLPVSASVLPLYTALSAASEGAHFPMSEAMIATGIELAPIKHRSTVNFLSFVSYCLGVISMALVAWFLKNWIYFTLVAAVLCFIPLLLQRYVPESPRWLINKGHKEEAFKVLEHIARTNGKPFSTTVLKKIDLLCQQRSSTMGIRTIITNKNLLKNTILLVLSSSFGENPFVAFIGKGSLQLAASCAGHIVGNRFRRRITQCLVLLSAAFFCFILIFLTTAYSAQWIITTLSLMLLFCAECSYVLTNLQSLELHPTSLRQIGIAVEYVFVQCVMTAPPYLAHLGKTTGMYTVFSVLAAVTLIMTILMSFVPESFHEKLPETKEDISHFGKKQKYWSLPNKSEKDKRELCC